MQLNDFSQQNVTLFNDKGDIKSNSSRTNNGQFQIVTESREERGYNTGPLNKSDGICNDDKGNQLPSQQRVNNMEPKKELKVVRKVQPTKPPIIVKRPNKSGTKEDTVAPPTNKEQFPIKVASTLDGLQPIINPVQNNYAQKVPEPLKEDNVIEIEDNPNRQPQITEMCLICGIEFPASIKHNCSFDPSTKKFTCDSCGAKVDELSTHKCNKKGYKCKNCGSTKHNTKFCLRNDKGKEEKNETVYTPGKNKIYYCKKCKQRGHMANECTTQLNGNKPFRQGKSKGKEKNLQQKIEAGKREYDRQVKEEKSTATKEQSQEGSRIYKGKDSTYDDKQYNEEGNRALSEERKKEYLEAYEKKTAPHFTLEENQQDQLTRMSFKVPVKYVVSAFMYYQEEELEWDTVPISAYLFKLLYKYAPQKHTTITRTTYQSRVSQDKNIFDYQLHCYQHNMPLYRENEFAIRNFYFFHLYNMDIDRYRVEQSGPILVYESQITKELNDPNPNLYTWDYMYVLITCVALLGVISILIAYSSFYNALGFTVLIASPIVLGILLWLVLTNINKPTGDRVRNYRIVPYCLLPCCPVFSTYLEETLKIIPGFWLLIGLLEAVMYRSWKGYYFHKRSMKYSWKQRVEYHLLHNKAVFSNDVNYHNNTGLIPVFDYAFNSLLYNYHMSMHQPNKEFKQGYERVGKIIEVPSQTLPDLKGDNFKFGTIDHPEKRLDFRHYAGSFVYAAHIGSRKKPAGSIDMQMASYYSRILAIDNSYSKDISRLRFIAHHLPSINIELPDKVIWFNNLQPKQKKAVIRDRLLQLKGKTKWNIELGTKSDEWLLHTDKFVSRIVFQMGGYWSDLLGAWFDKIEKAFKETFSATPKNPIQLSGKTFYFYYTSGARPEDIETFFEYSDQDTVSYYSTIMGDDSLVRESCIWSECDFSKYDRTQNYQLLELIKQIFKMWGLEELSELWWSVNVADTTFYNRKNNFKIPTSPFVQQKPTGERGTSMTNSLLTMLLTLHAFTSPLGPVKAFESAGVNAKFKTGHKYPTYLRGVLLDTTYTTAFGNKNKCRKWIPLPSCFSKLGKIISSPDIIFTKKQRKCLTNSQKAFMLLSAQWLSYGNAIEICPYYKGIYETLVGVIGHHTGELHRMIEKNGPIKLPWEFKSLEPVYDIKKQWDRIDKHSFDDFMIDRYGISGQEFLESFFHIFFPGKEVPYGKIVLLDPKGDGPFIYHNPVLETVMSIDN